MGHGGAGRGRGRDNPGKFRGRSASVRGGQLSDARGSRGRASRPLPEPGRPNAAPTWPCLAGVASASGALLQGRDAQEAVTWRETDRGRPVSRVGRQGLGEGVAGAPLSAKPFLPQSPQGPGAEGWGTAARGRGPGPADSDPVGKGDQAAFPRGPCSPKG